MAGTYAHIALVYSLCRDTDALDSIASLTSSMKRWLMVNEKFCELGAVSPDYPYLALFHKEAEGWANIMHYWKTADFVRHAAEVIHELDWRQVDTPTRTTPSRMTASSLKPRGKTRSSQKLLPG